MYYNTKCCRTLHFYVFKHFKYFYYNCLFNYNNACKA